MHGYYKARSGHVLWQGKIVKSTTGHRGKVLNIDLWKMKQQMIFLLLRRTSYMSFNTPCVLTYVLFEKWKQKKKEIIKIKIAMRITNKELSGKGFTILCQTHHTGHANRVAGRHVIEFLFHVNQTGTLSAHTKTLLSYAHFWVFPFFLLQIMQEN